MGRLIARRPARFDWTGHVSRSWALGALTYALIEGGSAGFGSSCNIVAFLISAVSLTVFLVAEHRGRHPMIPLALFRSRTAAITLSVAFFTMAGFYGTVFLQSLYFQEQRGYSALATGLLFLPMTGLVALTNPLVSKIALRFGRIPPIIAGQAGMVSGLLLLALLPLHASVLAVAAVMILVGAGGAFTVPPIASLILDSVPGLAIPGAASRRPGTRRSCSAQRTRDDPAGSSQASDDVTQGNDQGTQPTATAGSSPAMAASSAGRVPRPGRLSNRWRRTIAAGPPVVSAARAPAETTIRPRPEVRQ